MGGAARIIRRFISPAPAYTPPPAQMVSAAPAAKATISGSTARVRGQGSGVMGTIMTSAEGLEEEANVSKAQLGGTILKKKKYKV
jgi:hypothetical protein